MEKFNYNEVPRNFGHCCEKECVMSDRCLRAVAWKHISKETAVVNVVNPAQTDKEGNCRFFKDAGKVFFAKGFRNMQKKMYPEQYAEFSRMLMMHFGRNAFFVRRRGEMLMSPSEQEIVRKALNECGAKANMDFDDYVEKHDFQFRQD